MTKQTPVYQLVDHDAFEELFDVPFASRKDIKSFESDMRRRDLKEGAELPVYVGVVSVTRHYGGPEEGGWYYDWHQVEDIATCYSFLDTLRAVKSFRRVYPTCSRGRGSVIGGADTFIYMSRSIKLIENCQTKERPRYE